MQCRSCRNAVPDAARFCDNCGEAVAVIQEREEAQNFLCLHCGATLRGTKKYCVNCGFKARINDNRDRLLQRVKEVFSRPAVQFMAAAFLFAFFVAPMLFMMVTAPQAAPPYEAASPAYLISTVAGPGPESSGEQFASLDGVAMDRKGNLYISDPEQHQVLKMDVNRVVRVFAGTGEPGFSGDNGPAYAAQLNRPTGLAIDAAGYLYIADTENHRIRRVSPTGTIQTIAGSGPAGDGNGDYAGDGLLATSARLDSPTALYTDEMGNVYFSDTGNRRLRKLRPRASKEESN